MKSITSILVLAAALPLASAWSVAFYTGEQCNGDSSFNEVTYAGTGFHEETSLCIVPGDPATPEDNCQWYTNNGQDGPSSCTGPMVPQPISFYFPAGTACYMGYDSTCGKDPQFILDPDTCHTMESLGNGYIPGRTVYFQCFNFDN